MKSQLTPARQRWSLLSASVLLSGFLFSIDPMRCHQLVALTPARYRLDSQNVFERFAAGCWSSTWWRW
jgi:hypothetical protein